MPSQEQVAANVSGFTHNLWYKNVHHGWQGVHWPSSSKCSWCGSEHTIICYRWQLTEVEILHTRNFFGMNERLDTSKTLPFLKELYPLSWLVWPTKLFAWDFQPSLVPPPQNDCRFRWCLWCHWRFRLRCRWKRSYISCYECQVFTLKINLTRGRGRDRKPLTAN